MNQVSAFFINYPYPDVVIYEPSLLQMQGIAHES